MTNDQIPKMMGAEVNMYQADTIRLVEIAQKYGLDMSHEILADHPRFKSYFAQNRPLFARLAQRQTPHTLLISCCDSRVPPELVLGADPGELFVVRSVANIVPPAEGGAGDPALGAAIEYVLEHLRSAKRVAILGHYGCGGVKGLDDLGYHISNASPLGRWLSQSARVVDKVPQQPADDRRWREMVEWNIRLGLENLLSYPAIRGAVERDEIELVGLVYDWSEGEVRVLEVVREAAARPFSGEI